MKKEAMEIWVKALRSGEFKQGKDWLCHSNSYCCLGALCAIALVNGVCDVSSYNSINSYDGSLSKLPISVMEWAQMHSALGEFRNNGKYESLAEMNDRGKSFAEIADIIEKNWEQL